MRSLLIPRLVDPRADEPGLLVGIRDERRCLLVDLGQIGRLPPRTLLRVSHAFVTHTHMDHFAGFDLLLAMGLGRMERLVLWGGPGFVDQVEHKLRAYTWNVVHRYEVGLTLEVHEIRPDGGRTSARFCSRERFMRQPMPVDARDGTSPGSPRHPAPSEAGTHTVPCTPSASPAFVLHDETAFRVRACFVDHEMPVLAFALEEKARVRVAPDRLAALGLTTGAWLRDLKHAVLTGAPDDTPIRLRWQDRHGTHEDVRTVGHLRPVVLDVVAGRRTGYVTDLRHTPANVQALQGLLAGADLLFIESVFLETDLAHAQRKNHLTARQAGDVARQLGVRDLVPFHFSPRYEGRTHELVAEARAAWAGEAAR